MVRSHWTRIPSLVAPVREVFGLTPDVNGIEGASLLEAPSKWTAAQEFTALVADAYGAKLSRSADGALAAKRAELFQTIAFCARRDRLPCAVRNSRRKNRACYQRNKARDIHDLGMFAARPLDRPLIRRLVVLKLCRHGIVLIGPLDPEILRRTQCARRRWR
jgi:hypothetical protein